MKRIFGIALLAALSMANTCGGEPATEEPATVEAAGDEKVEVEVEAKPADKAEDDTKTVVEANEDEASVKSGDTNVKVGADGSVKVDVPGVKVNVGE